MGRVLFESTDNEAKELLAKDATLFTAGGQPDKDQASERQRDTLYTSSVMAQADVVAAYNLVLAMKIQQQNQRDRRKREVVQESLNIGCSTPWVQNRSVYVSSS